MVITTVNYADFKSALAMLRHVDKVFYNTSATTFSTGGGAGTPTNLLFGNSSGPICFLAAYDIVSKIAVQYVGPNGTPDSTTITTDFPSAVALNSFLATAELGPFNI